MNETINTLVNRKSARSFQEGKHVPKEVLDQIVAAGLNAPSGKNKQSPLFIVVSNDEMVKELSKLNAAVMNIPADPFYGALDVIAVVAKKQFTYIYDGSLAMGNLLNAAYSLGVDARWIHRCKEVFETPEGKQILQNLGITDEVEGIGFCILGYAKEDKPKTEIQEGRVFYIE